MATRKTAKADPPPLAAPPWYEATVRIYWYNPEGGSMPLLAHAPGDRVTPEDVERNGWGALVKVPDMFDGSAPPPVAEAAPPEATGPEGTAPEQPDSTQRLDPAADDAAAADPLAQDELPLEGGSE